MQNAQNILKPTSVIGEDVGKTTRANRFGLRRTMLPYLLLLPALVFLTLFTYWPFLQAILSSFSSQRRVNDVGHFVGFENYHRIFSDVEFTTAAFNNLVYAIGTTSPSIVLALVLALSLRNSSRFNSLLRSVFFFPTLIPLVAASAVFIFIFMPDIGLLDFYLAKLGARSVNWLGNPNTALASLIALTIWKNAGYYMLFFWPDCRAFRKMPKKQRCLKGPTVFRSCTM